MPTLSLTEVGWCTRSDGIKFPTTFRVAGLPIGDDCVIGYDGASLWKITWHRGQELIPISDPPYERPDLALEAIRKMLTDAL